MNFRTTLIIFVVFVVLASGYFLFWGGKSDKESQAEEERRISEVYGLDKDEVQRIRLSFKDPAYESLTLAKNADGIWQLIKPITADATENKVNEMLGDLLNKRVKRTMDVTGLSQYELDPPNIEIELWTEGENPTQTFLIGNKTVNYSVYAKEQSESQIFLIESSALSDFTKSATDFRTRNVLNFEANQASGISLEVAGREGIRCQKGGEEQWKMIQPIQAKADAREIRSILGALGRLKVVVFEADGVVDLAKYALDTPRIRIVLQSALGSQQLLIGSDTEEAGRIYVKPGAHNAVYAVNKGIYATLNKTVFNLRDKRVIDFQRTATNRFEIRKGTERIVCAKNMKGEWQIEEPVVLKADATAVDDLLFGVDSLKAVGFVSDQPKSIQPYGLDHPSIQVSFITPDSDTAVLLVGKQEGDNIYVKARNAARVVLVKNDLVDLVGLGVAGLRDKRVFDFKSDDAFKLTLKHGNVKLTCQKQGANWRLISPVQEDAENGAVNSIISQIDYLKVEKFLTSTPSVVLTGLGMPEVQVTVTLKDQKEYTLQIGKTAKSDQCYGRLRTGLGTIFLLKADVVDKLKKTVEDLRVSPDGA